MAKTKARGKNPRQAQRGKKVQREEVICEQCGSTFSRAIVHPYIVKCPDCRGTAKKTGHSRLGCKHCRKLLERADLLEYGMFICSDKNCKHQYWIYGSGWYKSLLGENRVYFNGQYKGSQIWYGDFRRILDANPELPRPD